LAVQGRDHGGVGIHLPDDSGLARFVRGPQPARKAEKTRAAEQYANESEGGGTHRGSLVELAVPRNLIVGLRMAYRLPFTPEIPMPFLPFTRPTIEEDTVDGVAVTAVLGARRR
jgi:hypothetical protein